MVIGVTMVKVVPGQEKTVYNALQEIDGIKHPFDDTVEASRALEVHA